MTIILFIAMNFGTIYRTTKRSYRDSPTHSTPLSSDKMSPREIDNVVKTLFDNNLICQWQ